MKKLNLNDLSIPVDDHRYRSGALNNYSISIPEPHFDNIEAIFKDIEPRLIDIIQGYKDGAIFGCVAWLTSFPILKALSNCEMVQIIVQKEDFLRPDIHQNDQAKWKKELRQYYGSLKCELPRYHFREPMGSLSTHYSPEVDPVRCVGNYNSDKIPASPRVHHKFLVFCDLKRQWKKEWKAYQVSYIPTALWTGSFNLTKNATYSFENALFLTDKQGDNPIISAYLNEHHQIFGLSEKLDWESEWVEPEYRLGT